MNYKLVIKHEAFIDTVEAFIYYEKKQNDLGETFLSYLDIFYERIIKAPYSFPSKRKPYHEAFIKRFPLIIIYEIIETDLNNRIRRFQHTSKPKQKTKIIKW